AARALALADESVWEVRQKLVDGLTAPRSNFQPLAETWAKFHEDAGKDRGAVQRARASLVLKFLIAAVEHALKLLFGAPVTGLDGGEGGRLKAFAERVGTDGLMELLDKCVEADFHVERRVQLILVVESVVEKFTRLAAK